MSMICCLIDVDEAQINELLATPDKLHKFVEEWFEGEEILRSGRNDENGDLSGHMGSRPRRR